MTKYQLMHIEMFPYGIIHAECFGGDMDLLLNRRCPGWVLPLAFCGWRSQHRAGVAFVDDDEYEDLMKKRESMPKTKFGDAYNPTHVERLNSHHQERILNNSFQSWFEFQIRNTLYMKRRNYQ